MGCTSSQPVHKMCGHGEVKDMVNCLKSRINRFCQEMPQERPKRKCDKRRVEMKRPKIKHENDDDLLLSPIKEENKESECVIIEDDDMSDKHSDTSADTSSADSDTGTDFNLQIFDFF